jgi:hypothetical protein
MERPFIFLALGASLGVAALSRPATFIGSEPRRGADPRYCYTQSDDLGAIQNGAYDGRFTFFRVMFEPLGGGGRGFRRQDRKWDHDTPRAEQHLMKILQEITTLRPQMDCGAIHAFGDPESFRYPIAYVSEPGFWTMNDEEVKGIRDFVHKGGFIIFDDYFADAWYNFERMWQIAFPDLQIVKIDKSHPIYDSFYRIDTIDMIYQAQGQFRGAAAEYYGAYEDNDPKKRLVMIANYNNDLGDYIEYSDEGWVPIELSNEAYKLMVNYIVYGLTH